MGMSSEMPFLTTFCLSPTSALIPSTSRSLAHNRNTMNLWMNQSLFLSSSPFQNPPHIYHLISLYNLSHWEPEWPPAITLAVWPCQISSPCTNEKEGPRCGHPWVEPGLPGTGTPFLCNSLCPLHSEGAPPRPRHGPELRRRKGLPDCPTPAESSCTDNLSRLWSAWPDNRVKCS